MVVLATSKLLVTFRLEVIVIVEFATETTKDV